MLAQLRPASPTMKLTLNQIFVFLHPSPAPEHLPSADPMITGVVTLTLPKRKCIRFISVRLVKLYSLLFSNGEYESGEITEAEVSLASPNDELLLEKGEHNFAFTIILPSSLAPTERSQHGRVFYKIIATAKGEGLMGSDITADKRIYIIVSPAADGETNDLNLRVEGFLPEIGPYAISTVSHHLTVGGILNFDLILANPPTTILIHAATVYINTIYTLKSIKDPTKPIDRITRRLRVFSVNSTSPPDSHFASDTSGMTPGSGTPIATSPTSFHHPLVGDSGGVPPPSNDARSIGQAGSPLHTIAEGHSYQLIHLARVPSDDFIRPSTLLGTDTPISVAHELVFEVTFEAQHPASSPKGKRAFRVERSITISSCCCKVENLLVPIYAEVESPVIKTDAMKAFEDHCVCATSKDQLILQQRLAGVDFIQRYEGQPTKAEYRPQSAN